MGNPRADKPVNPIGHLIKRINTPDDLGIQIGESGKHDVLRVLHCLEYVRNHLNVIAQAVLVHKLGNTPGKYRNQHDLDRKLLRDDRGTSFHMGAFATPKDASHGLTSLIQQVEEAITELSAHNKKRAKRNLLIFLNHFQYDYEVGCLEARTHGALLWAATHFSTGLPQFEDLVQSSRARLDRTAAPNKHESDALFHHILNSCKKRKIAQCVIRLNNTLITCHVTPQFIANYLYEILNEEVSDQAIARAELKEMALYSENWIDAQDAHEPLLLKLRQIKKKEKAKGVIAYIRDLAGRCNQIVFLKNNAHETLFEVLIKSRTTWCADSIMTALINELTSYTCNKLYISSESKLPLAHLLVHCASQNVTELFLAKLDCNLVHQFNQQQEKSKNVLLGQLQSFATRNLSPLFIHDLSAKSCYEIALAVMPLQQIGLVNLIRYHPDAALALIRKLSIRCCNELVLEWGDHSWYIAKALFFTPNSKPAIEFLTRLNDASCNRLITRRGSTGITLGKIIVRESNEETLYFLIKRITAKTWTKILNKHSVDYPTLHQLFKFQSVRVCESVVEKLSQSYLMEQFKLRDIYGASPLDYIALRWNSETFEPLIKIIHQRITAVDSNYFYRLFQSVPIKVYRRYTHLKHNGTHPFQLFFKDLEDYPSHLINWLRKDAFEGMLSLKLLRIVSPLTQASSQFDQRLECLQLAKVKALISGSRALVKVVHPDHLDDFINAVANPVYRHQVRITIDKASNRYTHKFVHLKGTIEPYHYLPKSSQHKYTHTKKTSMTLLSSRHCDSYLSKQAGVAFLFDFDLCQIKAMLKYDAPTFTRKWLGDENTVRQYSETVLHKRVNYTNVNEFVDDVNQSSHLLNEVLAGVNTKSCIAVLILFLDDSSRRCARDYQQKYYSATSIELPIMYYDRLFNCVRHYDEVAQKNNIFGTNSYQREIKAKIICLRVKDLISDLARPVTQQHNFWAYTPKLINQLHKQIISAQDMECKKNTLIWIATYLDCLNLLDNVLAKNGAMADEIHTIIKQARALLYDNLGVIGFVYENDVNASPKI